MAKTPYVRFYWSDWIADTSHLDLMQLGAYMRLLEHIYQHARPLPGDLDKIFRICHATSTTEQHSIRGILAEYFVPFEDPEDGPQWRHLRAEREMDWAQAAHAAKSAKARHAAQSRWSSQNDDAQSMLQASLKQCSSNANQNHNHNQSQEEDNPPTPRKKRATPKTDLAVPEGIDPQAWEEFAQHRKDLRKPLTALSTTKNANVLRGLTSSQQRESVNASIANGWTGLFAPKPARGAVKIQQEHEWGKFLPEDFDDKPIDGQCEVLR